MGFAIAGAALGAGYLESQAAGNAASQEASAANNASNVDWQIYQSELANEKPWLQAGQQGLTELQSEMPGLTAPFTMQDFQESPGYQFQLQQGLQAIQNSNAARGLGGTGSANSMDMANYAEGLANTDYQNAFNNYQTQQTNTYNKLAGIAGLGQTATAGANSAAQNAGTNISGNIQSIGNAQAANSVAQGNIIGGAITNATNGYMNMSMLNRLMPQPSTGIGGGGGGTMSGVGSYSPGDYNLGTNTTLPQYSFD